MTNAFNAYLKAVNDEQLANKAYLRADDLLKHGAISQAMVEQAEDSEKDAKADLVAAEELQLKVLGVDKDHPSPVVNVSSPISGVMLIAQNVTNAAAAGAPLSGSATAFTDCRLEFGLDPLRCMIPPQVHIGQEATHLSAYPDRTLTGHISDIGPVLDPSIRTAKVRIVVPNPGILRLGMFVTATFSSLKTATFIVVPAAVLPSAASRLGF